MVAPVGVRKRGNRDVLVKKGTERCGEEGLASGEGKGRGAQGTWKEAVGACNKKPGPRIESSEETGRDCNGAGIEGAESALGGGACSKVCLTSLIFRSRLFMRQLFFSSLFHGINGLCGLTKFVQQSINSEMKKIGYLVSPQPSPTTFPSQGVTRFIDCPVGWR